MQSLKRNWLVVWKLISGIWQILTWTLESLKNVYVNELLLSKLYIVWGTEKLSFISLKSDVTFGGEFNWVVLKLTWGIWPFLTRALESLKNFYFNELLLRKVYIDWAKSVKGSYLSWHWRVMQNLKRNLLAVSKVIWGIWQILTWALKSLENLHFNALFFTKVYNFEPKSTELCLIGQTIDAKFQGKLTCASKNDMRNLENFHRLKNGDFILERKMAELNQNKNSKQQINQMQREKFILPWK